MPAWVPIATTVAGTVLGAKGQLDAGDAARVAGQRTRAAREFEAAQLEQQAGQSIAAAQRDMLDEQRRARLAQSRAIALAAASGAGASDPTVVDVVSDLAGEGAYRAGVALYRGEDEARKLRMAASTRRLEGQIAEQGGQETRSAYRTAALGTVFRGAASLYGKYSLGGPQAALSRGVNIDAGITPTGEQYG